MNRWWAWARVVGGLAILGVLVWRVGTGPFLDGIRRIDLATAVTACAIGAVTTAGAAWRWQLVASGLGVRLPLPGAVAAYYRSQFLNSTLPGGIVGDVHRAVRHGVDAGDVGGAVRAVVLERVAALAIQVALAVIALLALPSPVRGQMPLAAAGFVALLAGIVLAARLAGRSRAARLAATLRDGLYADGAWAGVTVATAVVLAGHLATFLLAAHAAGVGAPLATLAPLGLLGLLAMVIPLNVAGWGPREGVTAWAFGAAGLGAAQGVATSVVYGVLALLATAPGALVLLYHWISRSGVPALRQDGARG